MRFARWVFRLAGLYGIVLLTPFYFLEKQIGAVTVPIAHPEYFYGFVGTALSAQILFLIVSTDPVRFRPAMVACVIEKLAFGIPVWMLWSMSRVGLGIVSLGSVDLIWAALFTIVYIRLGRATANRWEHRGHCQCQVIREHRDL
ncbi:hypothetical protein [Microvirga lotononidis]|uniref:hypothetical protein n=1 Tax=Microvirga lotononidis TaxID=864069 RepID=UPI002AF6B1FD|nr:hypothetical protein [Microvirga lotononidis]WQO30880.1 hypothetical protein U0023_26080 [Microvirga lotononidis]